MSNRLERCYPNPNTQNPNNKYEPGTGAPPPPPPPLPRTPIPKIPPAPKSLPPLPPIPPKKIQQGSEYSCSNGGGSGTCSSINSIPSIPLPLPMPILSTHHTHTTTWSQSQSQSTSPISANNFQHQNQEPSIIDSKSSALLDSHDRFKPERSQRRLVRNMKWNQGGGGGGGGSRWSSRTANTSTTLAGDLFSCSTSTNTNNNSNHNQGHYGFLSLSSEPQMMTQKQQQQQQQQYCSINPLKGGGGGNNGGLFTNSNFIPIASNMCLANLVPLESESRVSSMTIADVSPRLAVKKVLLLYEHAQYNDAASFLQRLSISTFRIILRELPMDLFVEAMPHSLPIMESLYTKLFSSDGPNSNLKSLKPESIVMHMVKFFSREEMIRESRKCKETIGPFTLGCKRILSVIVQGDPKIIKILLLRRRTLDKAVEGMGQHGLVGTTDEGLLPLHDALRLEFRRVADAYKGALLKLEELSLSSSKNTTKTVAFGPAPIQASHQRQLSLRAEEIQDRLIKNKSLLNAIEPTLENHCLDILLGILQRRIEGDKEALFQFTQLRKEAGDISSGTIVAPLLMRYSKGVKQVLEMMREVATEVGRELEDLYEDDSSDLSGYHSDSDSAIMTSGNSPYVTPRARFNFLSRSLRSKAMLRPSIMMMNGCGSSSVSSSSGRFTSHSRSGSSGSSLPDSLVPPNPTNIPTNTTTNNNPIRPRHIKQKNQLHKNNSLVSNCSSVGDDSSESTTSSGPSPSGSLLRRSISGPISISPTTNGNEEQEEQKPSILGCIDCVTVVSVPDNQVITQGLNHRCGGTGIGPGGIGAQNNSNKEPNNRLISELKNEINQLRNNLKNANSKINQLQEYAGSAGLIRNCNNENTDATRNYWIREYGALYATARVETMDALDALVELNRADELKSKLLFSVVVLSFRSVQIQLSDVQMKIQNILHINGGAGGQDKESTIKSSPQERILLKALTDYLGSSAQKFDLTKSTEQVAHQLWTTLYDYPCLKKCSGLMKYIQTCVNLAWGLLNMNPPCYLEYETRKFRRELHVRFHSSDQSTDSIKTYLWPALLEGGPNGLCIHKGVVIT